MDVTFRDVAEYFRLIAPVYCKHRLVVEPMAFVRECSAAAFVNWNGDHWHILADTSGGVEECFRLCWHEVAHIRSADVFPGGEHRRSVAQRRLEARGLLPSLVSHTRQTAEPELVQAEDGANGFSYRMLAETWSSFESLGPVEAAAVHRSIAKWKESR